MTDKNLQVSNDKLTNELNGVLDYMASISDELPTTVLDLDYFIYAVLRQKHSTLYNFLKENMNQSSIKTIEMAYATYLSSKALSAVKPDRKIIYGDDIISVLLDAEENVLGESSKYRLNSNEDSISSLHVFLAILSDKRDENRVRKVFEKALCSYDECIVRARIFKNYIGDDGGNEEDDDAKTDAKLPEDNNEMEDQHITRRRSDFGEIPSQQGKNKSKYIESFCTNINDQVRAGKIGKLIGREKETNEILRVLGRKKKNNAILLGGEGVGKTAIAENLAYKIVEGSVPNFLIGKEVVSLDMTAAIAGTTLRGMFEERIKGILTEIKKSGKYILFIDNIGAVLADKGKNDYDISSMISRYLENGDCQVIGTSDFASFRKTFDKDPSLARRFHKIVVEAPTKSEAHDIINSVKDEYEAFHNVTYSNEALNACVELAVKYITDRNLPDSAIDILDETGSLIGTVKDDNEITEKAAIVRNIQIEIENNVKNQNYSVADSLKKDLIRERREYEDLIKEKNNERKNNPRIVTIDDILGVVSNKTGIPVNQLNSDDKKKLLEIDKRIKSEVIGQDDAIDIITRALKRSRVGLRRSGCSYSAMCIGKTGTGKTLIAKKLAKELFGSEKALIRFDMSEYPDKTAVNKLIGSNPGYVGYEDGGRLTEVIKNKKYCVLLLDEIEKADPEVYNIFLQVLDEGFLTDNSGQKIDFSNVIILFTSNVGAKAADDFGKGIGFNEDVETNTKKILSRQLKNRFPPEFINRLDNVIYFNSLSDDNMKDIIKIELNKLKERLSEMNYLFEFNDEVVDYILKSIENEKEFGARPIKRNIQTEIEDKITDYILENEFEENHMFKVSCPNNYIVVE